MWAQTRLVLEQSDLGLHCLQKMLLEYFSRQQKQMTYILTTKTPAKNASEKVVCCIYLLTLLTDASIRGKQCGPDQTAPAGAV